MESTVPGWTIIKEPEGILAPLLAVRHAPLTDYQKEFGAMDRIEARSDEELWLLMDAQQRLAERLALAEQSAAKTAPKRLRAR